MTKGRVFTGYGISKGGKFVKQQLRVFYAPPKPGATTATAGSLFWCPPGQRTESPYCQLDLDQITDIILGKHTPVSSACSLVPFRARFADMCAAAGSAAPRRGDGC